ncbi:uncharacterized protein CDAR_74061 [Caerostris darwini]|uniref:Uncharacterized protein n=1 Tax=Caerostris darwini TaxID=1538125 RepID=A0AAV4Q7F4_9ARAC|nr:uncharacterized protein CDAR_74061 [Caerostris darwini]
MISCSNTSLEINVALGRGDCHGMEENSQKMQADYEEAVRNTRFWKRYLKRKTGMQEMEESMEELVADCHYWRQLLLGLNYQNWILETEKKSFRSKYENLLEKVKHDMHILLKLKGSQKKLAKNTREYSRTDQELATARSTGLDRTSDRMVTEMERGHAVKRLQMNTSTMERINKFHRRIQSRIEEEKKRGEGNLVKYEKEGKVLRETLAADHAVFQDFKETFADRELPVDDLKAFVTDGLKIYLGLEKREEAEEMESLNEESEEIGTNLEEDVPAESVNIEEEKPKAKIAEEEKLKAPVDEKKAHKPLNATQKDIYVQWQNSKYLFTIAQQENSHLLKHHEFMNNRMKELTERYMELDAERIVKDSELLSLHEKASNLYEIVQQKRKKGVIPFMDPRAELALRIRRQRLENEGLRKILSLAFRHTYQDIEFHSNLKDEMKEFYTKLLSPEKKEEEASKNAAEEPITPQDTEPK